MNRKIRILGLIILFALTNTAFGQTDKEKALTQKYGVFGPPALIFFDENLEVRKAKTIIGFIKPADFLAHLAKL